MWKTEHNFTNYSFASIFFLGNTLSIPFIFVKLTNLTTNTFVLSECSNVMLSTQTHELLILNNALKGPYETFSLSEKIFQKFSAFNSKFKHKVTK